MTSRKLPKDVVLHFLSMLPVKSLLRFRCVCKKWCALIDSPSFIAKHLNHATTNKNECILVKRFIEQHSKSVLSFASEETLDVVSTNIDIPFIDQYYMQLCGPCNGIICLYCGDDLLLCNPATREFKALPPCIDDYLPGLTVCELGVGFGFDEKSNDYKVVRIIELCYDFGVYPILNHGVKAVIYNLCSDSWRKLDMTILFKRSLISYSPCAYTDSSIRTLLNGAFHWWVQYCEVDRLGETIVCFNMSTEVFEEFEHPLPASCSYGDMKTRRLAVLDNEYLALINYVAENEVDKCFEIWVMKEYGVKESWTKQFIIGPLSGICSVVSFGKYNELLLLGDNGELVFCDLEDTNKIRKFEVYGAQKHLEALLYIESLVSFNEKGKSLPSFDLVDIAFVPRSANKAAHWLASAEKFSLLLKDWASNLRPKFSEILSADFDAVGIG